MSKRYPFEHRIKRPFAYTPAIDTDVGKTIEKERKKLAPPKPPPPTPPANPYPIYKISGGKK